LGKAPRERGRDLSNDQYLAEIRAVWREIQCPDDRHETVGQDVHPPRAPRLGEQHAHQFRAGGVAVGVDDAVTGVGRLPREGDLAACAVELGADAAFEAVEALRGEPVGTVRITVPVSFGEMFLQDIIVAFQEAHPRIQIEMELENTFRDLQSAHIDIAIRAGLTDDPDQVAIPLGQLSELICASPEYWQAHPKPQTPADLAHHNCLVNFQYYKDRKWVFFSDDGPTSITAEGNLRLNHYPLIRNATVQGLGVARLPRYVAMPEIRAGQIETALENYRSPLRPIYLVYPYQGNLPIKNRLMIDFIRNWFADRPDLLETTSTSQSDQN